MFQNKTHRLSLISSFVLISAYICTWRFVAIYSFLLIPLDFFIIVHHAAVTARGIVYWIKRRKEELSFIPFFISVMALVVIFYLPPVYSNKSYHKGTYCVCGYLKNTCPCNLYTEHYLAASSFMATDLNSIYLTDLKNFRVYIGTYSEGDERIDVQCNRNMVVAIKTKAGYPTVIDKKEFVLYDLIKNHCFE